uniref:Uncharacterized protein n=1 Tax=Glossina palpalis gambiensis TaxID=67801 RepID=A0A1B0BXK4_9MUSC
MERVTTATMSVATEISLHLESRTNNNTNDDSAYVNNKNKAKNTDSLEIRVTLKAPDTEVAWHFVTAT